MHLNNTPLPPYVRGISAMSIGGGGGGYEKEENVKEKEERGKRKGNWNAQIYMQQ
jgi:hypothetical protein